MKIQRTIDSGSDTINQRTVRNLDQYSKSYHRSHKRPLALGPPYLFLAGPFLGRAIGTFPEFPVFFVGTVVWRSTRPIPPSAAGRLTISPSSRTWLRGILERRSP